jgi:hypothetical protein
MSRPETSIRFSKRTITTREKTVVLTPTEFDLMS